MVFTGLHRARRPAEARGGRRHHKMQEAGLRIIMITGDRVTDRRCHSARDRARGWRARRRGGAVDFLNMSDRELRAMLAKPEVSSRA